MSLIFNPFTGNLDFKGAGTSGGTSPWTTLSDTVTGSTTKAVDSVSNASFQSIKYIITVFNVANSSYYSFEYNVLNNGGSYKDTLSNRLKVNQSIQVNSVNNAGTFELEIVNNESFDLSVELAKLVLS